MFHFRLNQVILEAYAEPIPTSKMKGFVKIVNGCYSLTVFAKHSLWEV